MALPIITIARISVSFSPIQNNFNKNDQNLTGFITQSSDNVHVVKCNYCKTKQNKMFRNHQTKTILKNVYNRSIIRGNARLSTLAIENTKQDENVDPKSAESISFEGENYSYGHLTDKELLRGSFVLGLSSRNWVVNNSLKVILLHSTRLLNVL